MYNLNDFWWENIDNLRNVAISMGIELEEIPKDIDKTSERYKNLRRLTDNEELIAKLYWGE